jgi:acyl-CoA thioesterase I
MRRSVPVAAAALAVALLALVALPAGASERCGVPSPAPTLGVPPLSALLADGALTIVCLGSSSTQGVGASGPGRTYPAQLESILAGRLPAGARVEVVNRGVGGEVVADNLRRLERDVLARRPDLVVWQVGTNDALRGLTTAEVGAQLEDGVRRIRGAGAEVVLMDPQPLPGPEKGRAIAAMSAAIADVAARTRTALFSRHERMLGWIGSGAFTLTSAYGKDGLHMTDASYRCLAEDLAAMLVPVPATATTLASR